MRWRGHRSNARAHLATDGRAQRRKRSSRNRRLGAAASGRRFPQGTRDRSRPPPSPDWNLLRFPGCGSGPPVVCDAHSRSARAVATQCLARMILPAGRSLSGNVPRSHARERERHLWCRTRPCVRAGMRATGLSRVRRVGDRLAWPPAAHILGSAPDSTNSGPARDGSSRVPCGWVRLRHGASIESAVPLAVTSRLHRRRAAMGRRSSGRGEP